MTSWDWLGDALAIDAANTVKRHHGTYVDLLATPADLCRWGEHERDRLPHELPQSIDEADLDRFLEIRDSVLALLRARARDQPLPPASIAAVNDVATAQPVVRLLSSAARSGEPRLLDRRDPVSDAIAAIAAAAIELLTGSARDDISLCDAPSCGQLFLRDRPNQQWCGPGCGNRARAARHYQRHQAPGTSTEALAEHRGR